MAKKSDTKFDIPPLTPEQIRDAIVQMPNMPVMYFNHARVASSNFDLRIFLGLMNITAKNQTSITEQLCVVVSAEFAKMFFETLRTSLERYEALFGKIRPAPVAPAALPGPGAENTAKPNKRTKRVN
jgi:hypothetical protein